MSQLMMMYAWVGEDENGSGKVGLKIGRAPAGMVPLAAMSFHLDRLAKLLPQMEAQAAESGMKIRLMKFAATGEIAAETKAGKWSDDTPGITETDVDEFMARLALAARQDIIPKMKKSLFCFAAMDGPGDVDVWLALQLGLALALDMPLVVVATRNAPVSARLRQIADVIIEGETLDSEMKDRVADAVRELLRKRALVQ